LRESRRRSSDAFKEIEQLKKEIDEQFKGGGGPASEQAKSEERDRLREDRLKVDRLYAVAFRDSGESGARITPADAVRVYKELLQEHPGDVELSIGLADLLDKNSEKLTSKLRNEALQQADDLLDQMVERHPADREAIALIDEMISRHAADRGALENFRKTVADEADAFGVIGVIDEMMTRYPGDREEFEKRRKAVLARRDALLARYLYQSARVDPENRDQLREKRRDSRKQDFAELLVATPDDPNVLIIAADLYADNAFAEIRQSKTEPDPAAAAGLRSSAAENSARARAYARRLLKVAPNNPTHYRRVAALFSNSNQVKEAIETLKSGMKLFGENDFDLNLDLLPLLIRDGKFKSARETRLRIETVFRRRETEMNEFARLRVRDQLDIAEARILDLEGNTAEAIPLLKRLASGVALRPDPRFMKDERQRRWLMLAIAYSKLEQHKESGAAYDELIHLNPVEPGYYVNAAWQWGKGGDLSRKYERLDNAPNARAAWLAFAQYCFDQQFGKTVANDRDWEEFEEVVKQAHGRFGKNAAFVSLEAMAAIARNDRPAALQLLQTVGSAPDPDDARQLQRAWLVLADSALDQQRREPDAKKRSWQELDEILKLAHGQLGKGSAVLLPAAAAALVRNDRPAAISLLETFGSTAKIDVAQLPRLAALWQAAGNRAEADSALVRFRELGGDAVQWALAESRLFIQRGEASNAIAVLGQAREQIPEAERSAIDRRLIELEIDVGAIQSARGRLRDLRAAKSRDLWVYETVADLAIVGGDLSELEACEHEVQTVEGRTGTLWRYCRAMRLLETTSDKRSGHTESRRLLKEIDATRSNWPLSEVLRGCLAERSARDEEDKAQQQSEFDQAVGFFELALQSDARNLTALQRLVATLYRQKRYDEASSHIQQRGQFAWLSEEFAAEAVQAHLQVGRVGDAQRIARAAAELRPADATSMLLYAQCLAFDGKNRDAETVFRKATRIAPTDIRTWISLVRFYGRQHRQADARQALDELVAHVELTPFKREIVLAQMLDLIGDRPGAERHYLQALAENKADSNLLEEIGRFFLPSDPDKAFGFFEQALKADPKSTEARRQVALLCGLRGNDAELGRAIELLGQGEAAAHGDDRRNEAALLLRRGGEARCRQAVELLSSLVKSSKQPLPGDRLLLAKAYIDLAEIDLAQEQYEIVLKSREEPLFQVLFVRFLNRFDRLALADQWLSRLEQDGGSGRPEIHELRVEWLRRSRRVAEIEPLVDAFLESQMKLAKNDIQQAALIRYAADLFTDLKLFDAAEKKYREFVRRNPASYKSLALWLVERGRVDDALELCLEKSSSSDASSASVEACRLIALVCGLRGIDTDAGRAKELLGQGEAVAGGDDRRMRAALLVLRGEDERCRQAVELLLGQVRSLEQPVFGDRLLLARAYADIAEIDAAQEQYEILLKSRDEPVFQVVFIRFLNRNDRLAAAERWLSRLEQDGGSDKPEVLELRVDWLKRSQRVAEIGPLVDRFLDRQMKLTDDDRQQAALLRFAADLLTGVKFYDAAEKKHREIVQRNPAAFRSLAVWLAERGRVDEALTIGLERYSGPEATLAATCLVDVLLAAARLPSAVSFDSVAAERAIDAFYNAGQVNVEFLLQLAVLRSVQGRNTEAVAVYERMLKEEPDNPIILNNLAIVLVDIVDRRDEAVRCIEKVLVAYPDSLEVLDSQGLVLAGVGHFDEAHKIFEHLCKVVPNNARFRLHLAMTLMQLGDLSGSRKHAKIAIDNQVDTELLAPPERRFVNDAKIELSRNVP
jgi:tetratricopeptide (TPR) repeat protein